MKSEYRRNGRVIVRRGLALGLGLWLVLVVGVLPRPVLAAFDPTPADTISWFYAAAFGRTPVPNSSLPNYGDIDGLRFWTNEYLGGEGAQPQYVGQVYVIADFFVVESDEFRDLYGALDDIEYVTALYNNLLGRSPEQGGLDYWVGQLEGGTSRGQVLADFTNTPENRDSNPTRKQALESFIAFIDTDADGRITREEAGEWLAENPTLDAAVVDSGFLTLTVTTNGNGNGTGTVTSIPAGINCGSDDDCTANFAPGSTVTLTANAASDSTFDGWDTGQEDECSEAESCTVTMSEPRNVTATFEANIPLTVTKAGTGEGTVESEPAGINCGSDDCTANFAPGSTVTLTANAASGSTFSGWGGDCSGTAPCSITLSQARSVTATFNRVPISSTIKFEPSDSTSEYPRAITITTADGQEGVSIRFTATAIDSNDEPQLSCNESAGNGDPALVDWSDRVQVLVDRPLTLHAIACISNSEIAIAEGKASYTVANPSYFNDTGYDLCADRWINRSCSDPWIADFPGFPGQDGNYGRDAWARTGDSADHPDRKYALAKIGSGEAGFDLTKLAENGDDLPSDASDWACVRDNVTRLTWAVGSTADPNRRRTWFEANRDAAAFNSCGHTDWRLPTVRELHSILHLGRISPNLVAPDYFPEIMNFFWTQTPYVNDPSMRWAIDTDGGLVSWTLADEFLMRAFFVRGDDNSPLSDTPQFTIHPEHDGVAIQDGAGLMWMRCKVGKLWDNGFCADFEYAAYDWTDALKKVQDINGRDDVRVNFGYRDWRLPNVKELGSITDLRRFEPAVNTTVFPNLVTGPQPANARFWTATPEFRDGGISVYMNSGQIGFDSRPRSLAILLVRNRGGAGEEGLNTHLPPPGNDP